MERQSIVYTGSEGLSALSICLRKHNSVQYLSPPTKKPLVTHFSSPLLFVPIETSTQHSSSSPPELQGSDPWLCPPRWSVGCLHTRLSYWSTFNPQDLRGWLHFVGVQ